MMRLAAKTPMKMKTLVPPLETIKPGCTASITKTMPTVATRDTTAVTIMCRESILNRAPSPLF